MMERRFDMDDFEESLKEQTDNFVIFPSKRVWRGIYNDLHPGSKWPSLGIGIVFLITLVWLGFSSESTRVNDDQSNSVQQDQLIPRTLKAQAPPSLLSTENKDLTPDQNLSSPAVTQQISRNLNVLENRNIEPEILTQPLPPLGKIVEELQIDRPKSQVPIHEISFMRISHQDIRLPRSPDFDKAIPFEDGRQALEALDVQRVRNFVSALADLAFNEQKKEQKIITLPAEISQANQLNQKEAQDQTAKTLNKKQKRNSKVTWEYFAVPVVSSVYFRGHNLEEISSGTQPGVVVNPMPTAHSMTTNARLGFELGSEMKYAFSEKFKLITGAHVTYAGYNIVSEYVHPTITSLTLQDSKANVYSKQYVALYGNGNGESNVKLRNYNIQLGIPVGLQWQLWSNEDISIDLASSLEPFVVVASKGYILSSNGRNYINDPELMRKINLSGNFGSIITFSTREVNWHIGPNVRYQILSTYSNVYPVKEHLLHYGVRIGISGK